MGSRSERKQRERTYLDRFLLLLGELDECSVREAERPDFVIEREGSGALGVEVTRIYRERTTEGIVYQEQESLRGQLTEKVQSRLQRSRDVPPVRVLVFFDTQSPLRKAGLDSLACELVTAVQSNIPQVGRSCDVLFRKSGLRLFSVSRWESLTEITCSGPGADFVGSPSAQHIQQCITRKNRKVRDYSGNCDTVWLLIVADGSELSSDLEIPPETKNHKYDSAFERAFVLRFLEDDLVELQKVS